MTPGQTRVFVLLLVLLGLELWFHPQARTALFGAVGLDLLAASGHVEAGKPV